MRFLSQFLKILIVTFWPLVPNRWDTEIGIFSEFSQKHDLMILAKKRIVPSIGILGVSWNILTLSINII